MPVEFFVRPDVARCEVEGVAFRLRLLVDAVLTQRAVVLFFVGPVLPLVERDLLPVVPVVLPLRLRDAVVELFLPVVDLLRLFLRPAPLLRDSCVLFPALSIVPPLSSLRFSGLMITTPSSWLMLFPVCLKNSLFRCTCPLPLDPAQISSLGHYAD
jgi:hypothetical protein